MSRHLSYNLIFFSILIFSVLGAYYGVVHFQYPVPPGDDIYVHLTYTLALLRHSHTTVIQYPPGLYYLVIGLSTLFHQNILTTYLWLAPALLPISAVAIWYLARIILDEWQALLAYLIYALVSLQPLQTYFDGSLPNLLAAEILLPLLFATLIRAVAQKRVVAFIAPCFLAGLVVFCHHLTVLIMLGTLLTSSIIAIIGAGWERWRWKGLGIGMVLSSIITSTVAAFFWLLPVFSAARGIMSLYIQFSSHFPFFHFLTTTDTPAWTANDFGLNLGGIIFQAALVGVAVMFWITFNTKERRFEKILILCWFLLYLIGSLTSLSGEPSRLARDLSMPGAILAAVGISWLARFLAARSQVLAATYWILIVSCILPLVIIRATDLTTYSTMVRFSLADQQAYQYLLTSGHAGDTAVLTHQPDWQSVSALRDTSQQFNFVSYESLATDPQFKCYLDTKYYSAVSPSSRADSTALDPLRPALREITAFSDPSRAVRLLCRT